MIKHCITSAKLRDYRSEIIAYCRYKKDFIESDFLANIFWFKYLEFIYCKL